MTTLAGGFPGGDSVEDEPHAQGAQHRAGGRAGEHVSTRGAVRLRQARVLPSFRPSIHPFIHPFIRPSVSPFIHATLVSQAVTHPFSSISPHPLEKRKKKKKSHQPRSYPPQIPTSVKPEKTFEAYEMKTNRTRHACGRGRLCGAGARGWTTTSSSFTRLTRGCRPSWQTTATSARGASPPRRGRLSNPIHTHHA